MITVIGQVYDNTEIMHVIDAYLDIQKRYPNDYLSAAKLGNIYVAGHQYEDAILKNIWAVKMLKSVSYTHLDVYKRQV